MGYPDWFIVHPDGTVEIDELLYLKMRYQLSRILINQYYELEDVVTDDELTNEDKLISMKGLFKEHKLYIQENYLKKYGIFKGE